MRRRLADAVIGVGDVASLTPSFRVLVPVLVGVPLIRPDAGSKLRPAGSVPVSVQRSGAMPIAATGVALYG